MHLARSVTDITTEQHKEFICNIPTVSAPAFPPSGPHLLVLLGVFICIRPKHESMKRSKDFEVIIWRWLCSVALKVELNQPDTAVRCRIVWEGWWYYGEEVSVHSSKRVPSLVCGPVRFYGSNAHLGFQGEARRALPAMKGEQRRPQPVKAQKISFRKADGSKL